MKTELSAALLDWYQVNRRILPWRNTNDPYPIWVAEIMLQQTRVDTVIPYYQRWLDRFPTIQALASASQQDVLSAWEGLGYYSRARNLHRSAQIICQKYNGILPANRAELESLPGIGQAGSADILSIAFGQDHASVDGNIRRVIARLFAIQTKLGSPEFEKTVESIVKTHLPPGLAGDYNQAWMDLGATICLPDRPECTRCPLRSFCLANSQQEPAAYPRRKVKPAVPSIVVTAGVIQQKVDGAQRVLITRRPPNGLLGGMWEFPGGKQEPGETLPECLARELAEELGVQVQVGEELGSFRHAYTHFKVLLYAFHCDILAGEPRPIHASDLVWVSVADLPAYPMGKIDRMISRKLISSES